MFFITSHVTCQVDSNYDEESKKIDSIYSLLNSGDSNQAFINANKISNHLKNNRAKANLNLFFGYYYNGLANVDSSTYFTKKALKYSEVKNDSLTAGLYRIGFTTYKKGEVHGTFIAQVAAPVKLPGVVMAKSIEELLKLIK